MADYTLIDLFAGCGGMTLGFEQDGRFRSLLAVESDPDAAATWTKNFGPGIARQPDGTPSRIEEVPSFPSADVLIGGPPCQGFSPLNMKGVGFERRSLWREYLRALEEAAPSAFVMENVPELLRSAEFSQFERAATKLGYEISADVLNAADFGVPQTRRRAIVIGLMGQQPVMPSGTFFPPGKAQSGGNPWRTFRDAVRGLPKKPNGRNWHNARNPRPVSVERYETIPNEGEGRFELAERRPDITPDCWLRKKSGSTDVFGRLWWDRPAFTIRTEFYKPEKGRYLHPSEHRPITLREAARCMTFPDSFEFLGPEEQSMTSVAKQIGNAVPPQLARTIANSIADALSRMDEVGQQRGSLALAA
ncbi:MAG: DNA cytosine methyltransferase [Actinobacteria bacterium]|nr:DNA cytosine methyltransferase [Actinomycetota bacterium]